MLPFLNYKFRPQKLDIICILLHLHGSHKTTATRESTRNSRFSGVRGVRWGKPCAPPKKIIFKHVYCKYSNTVVCLHPISKLNTQTKSRKPWNCDKIQTQASLKLSEIMIEIHYETYVEHLAALWNYHLADEWEWFGSNPFWENGAGIFTNHMLYIYIWNLCMYII